MWIELVKDFLGQKAALRIDVSDADARAFVAAGTAAEVRDDPCRERCRRSKPEARAEGRVRIVFDREQMEG